MRRWIIIPLLASTRCTCGGMTEGLPPPPSPCPASAGFDAAPGTGPTFVTQSFWFHDRQAAFGSLADLISPGRIDGPPEQQLVIELAGLDLACPDGQQGLTLKLYHAVRSSTGGSVWIAASDLTGMPPQARLRLPATREGNKIRAASSTLTLDLEWPFVEPPSAIPLRLQRISAEIDLVTNDASSITGTIAGAVSIHDLSATWDPLSKGQTVLDETVELRQEPDVDLDGRGLCQLEYSVLTGRVAKCWDGQRAPVPPARADTPWTCADAPSMTSGFLEALRFRLETPARLVGIASPRTSTTPPLGVSWLRQSGTTSVSVGSAVAFWSGSTLEIGLVPGPYDCQSLAHGTIHPESDWIVLTVDRSKLALLPALVSETAVRSYGQNCQLRWSAISQGASVIATATPLSVSGRAVVHLLSFDTRLAGADFNAVVCSAGQLAFISCEP
jgi:hypothetical protein